MARTNNNNNNNGKYTSINFNHILQKTSPSSPSTASYSAAAGSYSSIARSHGRMLVLSRPSPKPVTLPVTTTSTTPTTTTSTTPPLSPAPKTPNQAPPDPDPDRISLRPLGRTPAPAASSLSSPVLSLERDKEVAVAPLAESPKPDRFVPPHLRPGFVGKREKHGPDVSRGQGQRLIHQQQQQQQQQRPGYFGYPGRYGQSGRPKSGGQERIRTDPDYMGRPRSTGSRPSSTGWMLCSEPTCCVYGKYRNQSNKLCSPFTIVDPPAMLHDLYEYGYMP